MTTKELKPNPGSDAALGHGCTCPARGNNWGRYAPSPFGWWVEPNCPLHSDAKTGPVYSGNRQLDFAAGGDFGNCLPQLHKTDISPALSVAH